MRQPASTRPYAEPKTSCGARSRPAWREPPRSIELKELLWSTQTREALALASDNYLAFALRESRMALADASAWPDKTLSALWTILDDPALNAALGIPHDFCANAARRDHPWR